MPEHEVRGSAFYDHELEDEGATGRRRGPVADWGVNEELFDHMPSRRRFRPSEGAVRREPRAVEGPRRDVHPRERHADAEHRAARTGDRLERAARTGARLERTDRTPDARARMAEDYARFTAELELPDSIRRSEPAPVADAAWMAELAAAPAPPAAVPDAADRDARGPDAVDRDAGDRNAGDRVAADRHARDRHAADRVAADRAATGPLAPAAAPSRDEAPRDDDRFTDDVERTAAGRRTVVIRGHGADPMRHMVARREREPLSAMERLGPRPDRLAAYAVVLGVLLILIAILTAHG